MIVSLSGKVRILLLVLGIAVGLCANLQGASSIIFNVATNGSDANPGTMDKPFASVAAAQKAVRTAREKASVGSVEVIIHSGFYELPAPLLFAPADSATATAPVVYRAKQGEKVTLSGGRRITGWKVNSKGQWETRIPEAVTGEWRFSQLFVNGQRRLRPRLPKTGSYFITSDATPKPGETTPSHDRLHFSGQDISADWHNLADVELVVFHTWAASRLRIASVRPEENLAILTGQPPASSQHYSGLRKDHRYFMENVREALDEPGEWYLDNKSGVLTYIPKPGENIHNTQIVAPRLGLLMEVQGDAKNRKWVEHIRFEGITFAHTNFVLPKEGYGCVQAEAVMPGAVRLEGAHNITFRDCGILHSATYALEFGAGAKHNRIENCDLIDMGAGGVEFGAKSGGTFGRGAGGGDEMVASHNTIENSTIAHGGRLFPAGIGVWIGNSHNNRVADNDIHDFFYSGMSVGWEWGYHTSLAHHNVIENNHIYNLGQRVLSDMGGIYTLGVSPGTVLRGNHIHHVYSFRYGGWGLYYDEGSTGIVSENNLVHHVKDGGFHQHYGRENVVRNNILAFSDEAQVKRTRAEEHLSFTFERNIVYWKDAPLIGSNFSGENFKFDNNLYWRTDGKAVDFMGQSLEAWQKRGQDVHSLIADPLFVDAEGGDYHLKSGSPAEKIGFKPFDYTKAGRKTVSHRIEKSVRPDSPFLRMDAAQKPPVQPVRDDFEKVASGGNAMNAMTYGETDAARIRVTAETAASGKQSLKFTDAPGLDQTYNPHIYYDPQMHQGTVTGAFSVRLDAGAYLMHEWRTEGNPYETGPALTFRFGKVFAQGKELMSLPEGEWVQIKIQCGLGEKANGKWSVEITRANGYGEKMFFDDLPCSKKFTCLRWMGFVSNATETTTFYVDELDVVCDR